MLSKDGCTDSELGIRRVRESSSVQGQCEQLLHLGVIREMRNIGTACLRMRSRAGHDDGAIWNEGKLWRWWGRLSISLCDGANAQRDTRARQTEPRLRLTSLLRQVGSVSRSTRPRNRFFVCSSIQNTWLTSMEVRKKAWLAH